MECPKICSTYFFPKRNTFKIKPSNFDSLKICDIGWFNMQTLFWTLAIIRIKI